MALKTFSPEQVAAGPAPVVQNLPNAMRGQPPINVTERQILEELKERYNSPEAGEGERRQLMNMAKDIVYTGAAKVSDELNPAGPRLLGVIEGKIRSGTPLTPDEQEVARGMFSNPANIDSLTFDRVRQYYTMMAGEIHAAVAERGTNPERFRRVMERVQGGNAFTNPLVEMAADIMQDPEKYASEEARAGLAQVYTSEYKRTSNALLDEAMQRGPQSWGEVLDGIRTEKMDSYRQICGLLGQDAVSEQQLAKAVGRDVESVRALRRDEYTKGTPLPEKLDDNFISREITQTVERIQTERAREEWTRSVQDFGERRLEERVDERERKRNEEAAGREREVKEEARREEAEGRSVYAEAEALREEMKLAGEEPPSLADLAEQILEKRRLEHGIRTAPWPESKDKARRKAA